jgi:glycerophosphoryl diester phosphodiesterase
VIAHRGASRAETENTVAAFRRAAAMGADAVELDVRRTADGALVVHHDAHLADGRAICELATGDLPDHLPTFAAALDACAGMWVNVEIKNDPDDPDFDERDSIAERVIAALAERAEPERWVISSFRLETIDRCRAVAPDIRTAWLTVEPPDGVATVLHERGHVALHPWYQLASADLIAGCHEHGVAVNVWTCDEPAAMRQLIAAGVDGICTNVPDVALSVVREAAAGPG